MRNRCVEICVLQDDTKDTELEELDLALCLGAEQVAGKIVVHAMLQTHRETIRAETAQFEWAFILMSMHFLVKSLDLGFVWELAHEYPCAVLSEQFEKKFEKKSAMVKKKDRPWVALSPCAALLVPPSHMLLYSIRNVINSIRTV